MGKIRKRIAVSYKGSTRTTALIDSGADVTVLQPRTACAIGFSREDAKPVALSGIGGVRLLGYSFPVEIAVGKRKAKVAAFVAMGRYDQELNRVVRVKTSQLLGVDFLQRAKAILNYGHKHAATFSGTYQMDLRQEKITLEERAALRRVPVCLGRSKR